MVVGNNDIYHNQWEEFKEYYGSGSYHFAVESDTTSDLYIVLDSGSGTIGKQQLNWLIELLETERNKHRHAIIMSHVNIWSNNFSHFPTGYFSSDESITLSALFAKHKVDYYINGHVHHHREEIYNKVKYLSVDDMIEDSDKGRYMVMNVGAEITYEYKETK